MNYYYIYILSNKPDGVLYIGVTSNLQKRVYEHKQKVVKGFTGKYQIDKPVYYEQTDNVISAISKEKSLKKWNREWKINLIKQFNPEWKDLFYGL